MHIIRSWSGLYAFIFLLTVKDGIIPYAGKIFFTDLYKTMKNCREPRGRLIDKRPRLMPESLTCIDKY